MISMRSPSSNATINKTTIQNSSVTNKEPFSKKTKKTDSICNIIPDSICDIII